MSMTDFTLGVNYWPRRKAMYWWSDFDAGEVREEFSLIREIGFEPVKIGGLMMGRYLMPGTPLAGERPPEEIRKIAATLQP